MDPTLAAIVTALAIVGAAAVVAHTRRALQGEHQKQRAMASERGLGGGEIRQLEHLARMLHDTSLADLLISPIRYNRAVARYVQKLRTGSTSEARYYEIIAQLTRLRRKVHPPGNILRFLHATRELPEGSEVIVGPVGGRFPVSATVWGVNEDHFEVRLERDATLKGLSPGAHVELALNRPGQGLYRIRTELRRVDAEPRALLRLEHSEDVVVENRRDNVRERRAAIIFVTPDGADGPIEANLHDISGGGLSFVTRETIPDATEAVVTMALGDSDDRPLKARAVVLRREELRPELWHYFARWHESLRDEDRETIIRFVFGLQRRRIRASRLI